MKIDKDSELVRAFARIISEAADPEVPPLKDEDICQDWAYAMMDKYFPFAEPGSERWIKARQFDEAYDKHEKMKKEDPEHHIEKEEHTIYGKNCITCSCGFSYKWDSSD